MGAISCPIGLPTGDLDVGTVGDTYPLRAMNSEPPDELRQSAWRLEQVSRTLSGWLPRLAGNLSIAAGSIEENNTALAALRKLIVDVGFDTANQEAPAVDDSPFLGSFRNSSGMDDRGRMLADGDAQ